MTAPRVFSGPSGPFAGEVQVPGDKSLSHRALLLAAMAQGTSRLSGLGPGADVASSAAALRRLGVEVDGLAVQSPGVDHWTEADSPIDVGNSGTTIRLLAGALSGRPFRSVLVGDESVMRRPMRRLVGPLQALGAEVEVSASGTPPVSVKGGSLVGAPVTLPVASAQLRTAVALAGLQAQGPTSIQSPPGYRDHTERWLAHLGLGTHADDTLFVVNPGPVPALDLSLPGDPSSAAFLWAAAAIAPRSRVITRGVSLNPGRLGFLEVLGAMGCSVEVVVTGEVLGDPVGDVTIGGAELTGTRVEGELALRAMDELTLVGVVAAFARGTSSVADASELRVKETDRIVGTVALIGDLGGTAEETEDGFVVEGRPLTGGRTDSRGDHRLAMAAAVAASGGGRVAVEGFSVARVSWPGFDRALERLWSSR